MAPSRKSARADEKRAGRRPGPRKFALGARRYFGNGAGLSESVCK